MSNPTQKQINEIAMAARLEETSALADSMVLQEP
jgi:hypothetical protein